MKLLDWLSNRMLQRAKSKGRISDNTYCFMIVPDIWRYVEGGRKVDFVMDERFVLFVPSFTNWSDDIDGPPDFDGIRPESRDISTEKLESIVEEISSFLRESSGKQVSVQWHPTKSSPLD